MLSNPSPHTLRMRDYQRRRSGHYRECSWCLVVSSWTKFCSAECADAAKRHLKRNALLDRYDLAKCSECDVILPGRRAGLRRCDACLTRPHERASRARRRRAVAVGERFTIHDLIDRDGPECWLCGTITDPSLGRYDPAKATFDHVVTIAAGGPHAMANTRVACLDCNVHRGTADPDDFRGRIAA